MEDPQEKHHSFSVFFKEHRYQINHFPNKIVSQSNISAYNIWADRFVIAVNFPTKDIKFVRVLLKGSIGLIYATKLCAIQSWAVTRYL